MYIFSRFIFVSVNSIIKMTFGSVLWLANSGITKSKYEPGLGEKLGMSTTITLEMFYSFIVVEKNVLL